MSNIHLCSYCGEPIIIIGNPVGDELHDKCARLKLKELEVENESLRGHFKRIISAHAALCSNAVYWENDGVPLMETAKPDFDALLNTVTQAKKFLTENGGNSDEN